MSKTCAHADIVIYKVKDGSRVSVPSLVTYDADTGKVLTIGKEAGNMNRDGKKQICCSPFRFGIIEDYQIAEVFLKLLIKREFQGMVLKPKVALCAALGKDLVAKKVYEDLLLSAGVRSVDIFEDITLDEFLAQRSEKELSKYTAVIWITKDNLSEYANELLQETYDTLKSWGVSKEQMVEIIQKLDA